MSRPSLLEQGVTRSLYEVAQQLRVDSVRCSAAASSGLPASSLSAADLMAVLLARHLRYDFAEPGAPDGGLDLLLELADSQISYRQRYVMIAALKPVIDLVMLDPNNPRSVEFQLDRIETHLGALPKQNSEGRLSPVQQIVAAIATRLRTVNASAVDTNLVIEIENSLMKLSDAISASFLTNSDRMELMWEALA